MEPSKPMKTFFHVGIVVEDIERSMAELTAALGVTWDEPHDSAYGPWKIRATYSVDGPPFLELVQGEAGGPWDTGKGSHLHHLGYWSDDVAGDSAALVQHGVAIDFDPGTVGRSGRFCYHLAKASGVRVEVVSASNRAQREPGWVAPDAKEPG